MEEAESILRIYRLKRHISEELIGSRPRKFHVS